MTGIYRKYRCQRNILHEEIHVNGTPRTKILYEQSNKGVFGALVSPDCISAGFSLY